MNLRPAPAHVPFRMKRALPATAPAAPLREPRDRTLGPVDFARLRHELAMFFARRMERRPPA